MTLTAARLVRVCRFWTLVYTERAVLEVTTEVTVVCPLYTVKQTNDIKHVTESSSFFNKKCALLAAGCVLARCKLKRPLMSVDVSVCLFVRNFDAKYFGK